MSTDKTSCPTLTGPENFHIWSIRISGLLKEAKVWDIVTTASAPPVTVPQAPPIVYYSSGSSTYNSDSWYIRDSKAHAIISAHVSDDIVIQVVENEGQSAKQLYDAISDLYNKTNTGTMSFYTFVELMNAKWDGTRKTLQEHLTFLTSSRQRLSALGRKIDDEFMAFLLLHTLPEGDKWETFKSTTLNALGKDQVLSFSDLSVKLKSTVIVLEKPSLSATSTSEASPPTTSDSALAAGKPQSSRSKSSKKTKQLYCDIHGSCAHRTEDCRAVKEKKKKKKKKKERAHRANDSSDDSSSSSDSGSSDKEHSHFAGVVSSSLKSRIHAYVTSEPKSPSTSVPIICDSGASSHMVPADTWYHPGTYKALNPPRRIRFGDDSHVEAVGEGRIVFHSRIGSDYHEIVLREVLHVPSFSVALISVPRLDTSGLEVTFKGGMGTIRQKSNVVMKARLEKSLYRLQIKPLIYQESAHSSIDINVLHQRAGHIGFDRLRKMVRQGELEGVDRVTGTPHFCEPCTLGKMKKLPFKIGKRWKAKRPFQLIHSDVIGPISPADPHGNRYLITFTDDYSRHPWEYPIQKKSQAQEIYNQFKLDVKAYFEEEVGQFSFSPEFIDFFRSDGGGEYTSHSFIDQLRREGTIREVTNPDTPEQNGLAERMGQTIMTSAVSLLIDSGLPKTYWSYAAAAATYVIARTPASGIKDKTPYQRIFGRRVDISMFRRFGCTAYALIPRDKRTSKVSPKARKCVMLGYPHGKKGYLLLDLSTRKIITSRHVLFDEDSIPSEILTSNPSEGSHSESSQQFSDMLEYRRSRFDPDPIDHPSMAPPAVGADSVS